MGLSTSSVSKSGQFVSLRYHIGDPDLPTMLEWLFALGFAIVSEGVDSDESETVLIRLKRQLH